MATNTSIEWTDYSENLIRYRDGDGHDVWGCVKCSPGCKNCYAEALAHRFKRGKPFTAQNIKTLTPYFDAKRAGKLLRSRKLAGKRVFMGDMTDVFGAWVPDALLDQLFAVMALRPDVTFQILTKRPERMASYLNDASLPGRIYRVITDWLDDGAVGILGQYWDAAHNVTGWRTEGDPTEPGWNLPMPNLWLGCSVEDQKTAEERIPHLMNCPAAVRFISAEPLLGAVDLAFEPYRCDCGFKGWACDLDGPDGPDAEHTWTCPDCGKRATEIMVRDWMRGRGIDWVIVGGESGAGARPCDVEWIRNIIRQCKAAGVKCFVKQLGAKPFDSVIGEEICSFGTFATWVHKAASWLGGRSGGGVRYKSKERDFVCVDANGRICRNGGDMQRADADNAFPVRAIRLMELNDRKGGDWNEWPEDMRVREMPEVRAKGGE